MKATLFDLRRRREAQTGGDRPDSWCETSPGGVSLWTKGVGRGDRDFGLKTL